MGSERRLRTRWITITALAGLLGGMIALYTAMIMTLNAATGRLEQYASEFLAEDERIARNIDATLNAGNGDEAKVPPASVGLELTERSTANKDVVVRVIHALRERGHVVYVDDFGTGYSSLSYLHELNVDVLKVDRAFTSTICTKSITATIVPQILPWRPRCS